MTSSAGSLRRPRAISGGSHPSPLPFSAYTELTAKLASCRRAMLWPGRTTREPRRGCARMGGSRQTMKKKNKKEENTAALKNGPIASPTLQQRLSSHFNTEDSATLTTLSSCVIRWTSGECKSSFKVRRESSIVLICMRTLHLIKWRQMIRRRTVDGECR